MTVIKFKRLDAPYGCLSNFSPHPVFLDGTTWPTVEHYFQAKKFDDHEHRFRIQTAKSPTIAKRLGRSRSHPLRADWEQVKVSLMRGALMAKVIQHADVRRTLLGTGDATIVEDAPRDRFWGDGGDGSGQNMLGRLWMEVRAELTRDGPYDELAQIGRFPPPWIKYPDIPRYSIGWRMGGGEAYLCEWGPWYGGLSEEGKRAYQGRFEPPPEWRDYWIFTEDLDDDTEGAVEAGAGLVGDDKDG